MVEKNGRNHTVLSSSKAVTNNNVNHNRQSDTNSQRKFFKFNFTNIFFLNKQ